MRWKPAGSGQWQNQALKGAGEDSALQNLPVSLLSPKVKPEFDASY